MTKQDQLRQVLEDVQAEVPEVHGAVLASRDGLAIVSTFGGGEGSRVAAMAATVHAIGDRVSATTELGMLEETVIRSNAGTFVVYDAGEPAVLALLADGGCNLGLIHLEGRRAAALFAALLTPTPAAAPAPVAVEPEPEPEPLAWAPPAPTWRQSEPFAEGEHDVADDELAPAHAFAAAIAAETPSGDDNFYLSTVPTNGHEGDADGHDAATA